MDKNIINSNKGIKLADEITQIMRDVEIESSITDYLTLKDVIENNEYSGELIEKICDENYMISSISSFTNRGKEESASQFSEKLAFKIRTKRRNRIVLKYTSSFAAAFIAISFLIYALIDTEKYDTTEPKVKIENQKINVPTLIYGDNIAMNILNKDVDKIVEILEDKSEAKQIGETVGAEVKYNKIIIPNKFTYSVILPDSTVVILNANSEIRYPRYFEGDERKVFIKGEAFFNVTKSDKPFIVSTERGDVKVYGTKFNVNLNRSDVIQILLINGSVGVNFSENFQHNEVILKPREVIEYNSSSGVKVLLKDVNISNYISWIDGGFKYDGIELKYLLQELSAWYGVNFEYRNNIDNIPISINLNRDIELNKLLNILETMTNVKFIKEKGGVYSVN